MRLAANRALLAAALAGATLACAGKGARPYQDQGMDFGAIKTVAVVPFSNLTRDTLAGERVRDVFSNVLLATGAVYVLPQGEVARGITKVSVAQASAPSVEEVVKLGQMLKADAVITGVVKEYGEVRSGSAAGNVVSLSLQMTETTTGKIVWAAESTKGGVTFTARLLGGGGTPLNIVTEQAVRELVEKLVD
jgi:hypothetical protein